MAEMTLEKLAAECVSDPLGFVQTAYPWGQAGTPLADAEGPDTWQREELERIGEHCKRTDAPFRLAIKSGHGVGKTGFSAWLTDWFMTTRPHPQVVVTANTQNQLLTKTWRELAKWYRMSLFRSWFMHTATRYYHRKYSSTWFAAAIPWSENKPDAFQGTHEAHVCVITDESSAIPSIIRETIEGAMTQPGSFQFAFGNPLYNTGSFRALFPGGRHAHRWYSRTVDGRTAVLTNKVEIAEWADTYGEDSDFFRIRVRGEFPKQSSKQFIGEDTVEAAQKREVVPSELYAIVIGVDVARYGDDASTIYVRQGPVILEATEHREISTMQLAAHVAKAIDVYQPQATFIDLGAMGAGVVDRLEMLGYDVVGVNFGGKPLDLRTYVNKRAEMWGNMRDWLQTTGHIDPALTTLAADLIGPTYTYDNKQNILLESKDDMKKRDLASTDHGDGLALTFAEPVAKLTRADLRERAAARLERYEPIERW